MSSGTSDPRRRLSALGAAGAVLAGFLLALPALGSGLLVSPGSLFETVPAGGRLVRQIVLTPTDSGPTRVRISVEPFVLDEEGRPDHGPGRTPPASNAARLEVSTRSLVLGNGKPQTLEVRYTSPAEARGSSWAVVLLELDPVRTGGQGRQGSDAIVRLALPVFVTVEETEQSELRIEQVTARWTAPDSIELGALLENRGNTVVRASGAWAAEDGGYELAVEDFKSVVILPGTRRRVRSVLTGDFGKAGPISGHLWVRYGSGAGQVVDTALAIGPRLRAE